MNFYNWLKPGAKSFYIFRHGETYKTKIDHTAGYPLETIFTTTILPEGISTIEKLAAFLSKIKFDASFSSPFLRCKQTVEIIEKFTKNKFKFDDRLGEFLEVKGETFEAFSKRIKNFLDDIQKKNYKSVAICTHGAGIAALKHWIQDNKFESNQLYDFPKPGILWTIQDNNNLESADFNRQNPHLRPDTVRSI